MKLPRLLLVLGFVVALLGSVIASGSKQQPVPRDKKISVDFPNKTRISILRNVADFYGMNFVVPANFPSDGRVSLKLKDVTWAEIFELTLAGSGFTFIERSWSVWLVTSDDAARTTMILRDELNAANAANERYHQALRLLVNIDDTSVRQRVCGELAPLVNGERNDGTVLLKILSQAVSPTPDATPKSASPEGK